MFYVYEWFIKETGEIIYVGKGCNRRYKVTKHNRLFNEMIRRFSCDSRIVKEFTVEKDAFRYEYQRISELKQKGQCVCNIYDGGCGGTTTWWTDELKEHYSQYNVMKSEKQRERMRKHNPMSDAKVAEKTNSQKRRKVTIGNNTYNSIKEAKDALGVSYSNVITWSKKGITPYGERCTIEPQKQFWDKTHGNQQPSRGNVDISTSEGSTTNG